MTALVSQDLLPCPPNDTLGPRRTMRRKRGPSLSRRTGQAGSVFQQNQLSWNPAAPAYGRFWLDSPEGRKRRVISLGTCATRTVAKRKLREFIENEGVNSSDTFLTSTTPGMAFREQAKVWISSLAKRRRRPVKPATIFGWQHALDKWILPTLGYMPLAEVSNAALKRLIETMAAGGLAAKTIVNYSQVPKMVVASVVNDEGDQVYPRKWNHDFIGLPIIDKNKQHRPTVTELEVSEIASHHLLPLRRPVQPAGWDWTTNRRSPRSEGDRLHRRLPGAACHSEYLAWSGAGPENSRCSSGSGSCGAACRSGADVR